MDIQSKSARPMSKPRGCLDNGLPESDSRRSALNGLQSRRTDRGLSRRSLFRRGGALPRRRSRRGAGRVREHDHAGGRRRPAGGGKGILGDPTAGGPGRRAGIPLARARLPGHASPPRRRGRELGQARARRRAADLQLRRLPQPGGHQGVRQAGGRQRPGHDVRHARRGVLEAQHRGPRVRRHLLHARSALAARRRAAHPAAELRADPQPAEERLAGAAQPVLRRRPALLVP